MDAAPSLLNLPLETTDPVLAHVVRFAHDVARRHRRDIADPARFRRALEGYYRAWRIAAERELPDLDARMLRVALAAYRAKHRELSRTSGSTARAA